eukprot:symbB.v1.2.013686.t1/scaffold971.1/size148033/14
MNQAYFPPSFPPGPGKFHESSSSIVINSSPALSQGRPSVPVRVGAPPVSGRQGSQASGSSTPGTATSGRAGSTGRLVARSSAAPVVVQTRSTLDGKGNIRYDLKEYGKVKFKGFKNLDYLMVDLLIYPSKIVFAFRNC